MSEVSNNTTFQERMYERIRDNIGDLITDEELKGIVEKALNKAFFDPTWTGSNYSRRQDGPSWTEEQVKELMEPLVKAEIEKQVTAKSDEIVEMVERVVQEGLGACMMKALSNLFTSDMWQFQNSITDQLEKMRNGQV